MSGERPNKKPRKSLAPTLALQLNDDTAEKQQRKEAQGAAPRKALAPVVAGATGVVASSLSKALSASQEAASAIDLCTRNVCMGGTVQLTIQKINQKTTWNMKLIELLPELINSDAHVPNHPGNTTFQKLTATLDASVKIYSSRVDSVHVDTFKMLGKLLLQL